MPRPQPGTGESIFFAAFYFGAMTFLVAQVTPNWGWWVAGALTLVGLLVLYGFRRALMSRVARRRLGPLFVSLPRDAVAGEALPLLRLYGAR